MGKKSILFVIDSLTLGGAEKSLVTLLNLLDYSKYNVDLLLFAQGGAFQKLLPLEVNLLPVPDYYAYNSIPWSKFGKKIKEIDKMLAQLRYSVVLRKRKYTHTEKAVLFWKNSRKCFSTMPQQYDVAIAYAQGVPTFFVAEKVKARKKAAWINVTYIPTGKYFNFIKPMYESFDVVNAVSEAVASEVQDTFGIPNSKIMIMKDILDVDFAIKMAEMPSEAHVEMAGDGIKILTVGRYAYMKGYDLAIDAAKILLEKGIKFKWYALGEGAIRKELEQQIEKNELKEQFILLGSRNNPYPYFKECDLYVQTSKYEGFGITLAEAKMFNKPIVTTNFNAVSAQFVNEKNGLIVDISARAIADGIMRMIMDSELRDYCVANEKSEKKGNSEEIEKLYQIIEG
ncbi:MAG: glycosyltransferase [Lachnospiraceae bacterium]|nr:glycosyltransferase [Lachnospiraceae bacterium]